jgi:diguanylate cyclase (GGDEF)-like protein
MAGLQHLARQLAEDPRDEGVLMNVTSGVMWLAAGAAGLVALLLPGTSHEHIWWLAGLALLSFGWGAVLLSLRYPRPGTCLEARAALTAALIGIVGVALWASGGASGFLQPILLFTALHVAFFYPPRLAWPLLGLFVLTYATPLLYDDDAVAAGYPARALMFGVAVASTYVIMRLLKRRLVAAEERQREMAERDPLTGLANRRAFDAALSAALAGGGRSGGTGGAAGRGGRSGLSGRGESRLRGGRRGERPAAALLLIDFDDFKAVNDTHGHPVGDAVLRAVAGACAPELRAEDCLARVGGDEFAVVAPGEGEAGATRLAAALETAIAAAEMPEGVGSVAVTVAWATAPGDGAEPEQLVSIADRRLLQRKRARKQRLTVAQV